MTLEFHFKGKRLLGQLRTSWLSLVLECIQKTRRRSTKRRGNGYQEIKLGRKYMYIVTFEVSSDISHVKLMNGIEVCCHYSMRQ
jgi:hypothetical protein